MPDSGTRFHVIIEFVSLQTLRSHLREEEYILNGRGVGHEHGQTVDSHSES